MKIITFSAIKGGVGKTTLTFNYGEWLSSKGYNVLLIDSDHQSSLTQTYDIYESKGTLANIFTKDNEEVNIIDLHENLSIIPASMNLDTINNEIQTRANKELLMYMWFSDHYNELKKFDYADHPLAKELTPVSILDYTPPHAAAPFLQTETTLSHAVSEERPHISSIPSKRRTLYSSAKPPSEF